MPISAVLITQMTFALQTRIALESSYLPTELHLPSWGDIASIVLLS